MRDKKSLSARAGSVIPGHSRLHVLSSWAENAINCKEVSEREKGEKEEKKQARLKKCKLRQSHASHLMGINKRNSRQENLPFDRKRTLVAINTHDEPIRTGLVTSTNRFIIGRHKRDSLPLGLGHTSVRVEEEPAVRTFWGRKCCVAKQRNPGMKSHKSCLIRTEDGAGSFVWLRSAHNSSCWES